MTWWRNVMTILPVFLIRGIVDISSFDFLMRISTPSVARVNHCNLERVGIDASSLDVSGECMIHTSRLFSLMSSGAGIGDANAPDKALNARATAHSLLLKGAIEMTARW
jgi:hypothetical protein